MRWSCGTCASQDIFKIGRWVMFRSLFGSFMHYEEVGKRDKMVRKASKSVEFLVKSFYSTLELDAIVSFPLKIAWDSWAPTKVVIYCFVLFFCFYFYFFVCGKWVG